MFVRANKAFFIDLNKDAKYELNKNITFCTWKKLNIKNTFIFGYVEFASRLSRQTVQTMLNVLAIPVSASLSQEERINLVGDQNERCTIGRPARTGCERQQYLEHKETKMSSGEQSIANLLDKYNVKYRKQFRPAGAPKHYRYDFFFKLKGRFVLLEFDGKQHFQFVAFFNKTEKSFLRQQCYDIKKTKWAIANNYYIIRLDYTCQDILASKLVEALAHNGKHYFSNVNMYQYILSVL